MEATNQTRTTQVHGQRKRARRFPVPTVIRYRSSADQQWREGQIENVSVSGVLFRADCQLVPETPVEMIYVLPVTGSSNPPGEVMCRGVVVRSVPSSVPGGLTVVGAKISTYRFVRGGRGTHS